MEWGCRLRRVAPLAIVLLASFLLRVQNLGHPGLNYFDESFHALVARNLLKHPLKPTLIDDPVLTYDPYNWVENHVWLHKPILGLWQIALSYAVLGVNNFALRLPSALLSTASIFLTYLIGRTLFDRRTALIAAILQAINPAMTSLVQGYMFADHVDTALLFWVELGVYFVVRAIRSGSWRDMLAAGVAQGLAYLTKSYLAGVIVGVAAVAWLISAIAPALAAQSRIRFRHLVGLMAATLVTALPWTLYCIAHYPREFFFEHAYVLAHLHSPIEIWGAPWDRVVFDYLITLYHVFYTPILVAALALLGVLWTRGQLSLWIVYAWAVIVLVPHLAAASKTPSATLIAAPAFFLLLGYLISGALGGDRSMLAAWAGIVAVSVIYPAQIRPPGRGFTNPVVVAGVMRQSLWVVGHVVATLVIMIVISRWARPGRSGRVGPFDLSRIVSPLVLSRVALAGTIVLGAEAAYASWKVTKANRQEPNLSELARFVTSELPPTAVFLFEGRSLGEPQALMLMADRPCYSLNGRALEPLARQALERGRIPYVISTLPSLEPALYRAQQGRLALRAWRDLAQARAQRAEPRMH